MKERGSERKNKHEYTPADRSSSWKAIPSDRLGAWFVMGAFGSGCWWEARPGPIPVEEAARVPAVFTSAVDGERLGVHVLVRSGSAHDPVGMEGLACATVGSQWSFRIAEEGDRVASLRSQGVDWETFIGPEIIRYSLWGDPDLSGEMVSFLIDTITERAFGPVDEILSSPVPENVGPNPVHRHLLDWLYAGHPYGYGAACDWDRSDRFGAPEMSRFHEDRFLRGVVRLALEVPADASETGVRHAAEEQLESLMGLPPLLYDDVTPRSIPSPMNARLAIAEGIPGELWMGWATELHPNHSDWASMLVAMEILGMRMSSVRIAGTSTTPDWLDSNGGTPDWLGLPLVLGWSQLSAPMVLLEDLLPRLRDWIDGPYTSAEIDRAKEVVTERLTLGLARRAAQADLLGWTSGWERLPEEMEQVDEPALVAALGRHLSIEDLRVVVGTDDSGILNESRIEDNGGSSVDAASRDRHGWDPGEPIRLVNSEL